MIDKELAQRIARLLNELFELDPRAMSHLVETRFQCNQLLADHPSVQVSAIDADSGVYEVGILGVLNGLVGADDQGMGAVASYYQDGELIGFSTLPDRLEGD